MSSHGDGPQRSGGDPWRRRYAMVLANLALMIVLLWAFTRIFR